MMEREYGHGAYGGPRGEAAYGGLRGEAGYGGPRGEAAFGGPRGEAAFGGPRGEAAFGGPRGEAAFGGPSRGEAAFGGPPRGEAAFGGPPRGEAAFGGPPRGEAAFGGPPRGEGAFGGPPRGEAAFGGPRGEAAYMASSYGMEGGNNRFGPYESYDSRSSLGGGSDLYRSGHSYNEPEPSRFADSYDDRYEGSYRNSLDSFGGRNQGGASWEASMARAKMRTGFMDERGRESYSSYSGFASPPMKPAPAGSRGRGMPSFPEGALGSRSYDAFGGMPAGRGRGMGAGGMKRPGIVVDYQNKSGFGGPPGGSAGRGTKRKMMPPPNKPVAGPFVNKKPKLAQSAANANKKKSDAKNEEEEEKRRVEARREKQRRRREKNSEKYGDGYRIAFTCSFCKFRTFEEKDIEVHLSSSSHRDTLNHIQKQTKFDKVIMEFLHECMVNKFKKTSLRKAQANQAEAPKPPEKDLLEGVSSDDHMMKVETVHCSACSVYVPALHSSVQQHIKSSDHTKSKQAYKEQIKRESVLTATSILNNPIVKARYKLFAKGENPFDITDPADATAEDAAEATENEGNEQNENEQNEENDDNEENENDEEAAEEEENEESVDSKNENGTT